MPNSLTSKRTKRNTASVSADHSISGFELDNSEGRSNISKEDMASLLMLLSNADKVANTNGYVPITILGYNLWFKVDKNIFVDRKAIKRKLGSKGTTTDFNLKKLTKSSDINSAWKEAVDKAFSFNNSRNEVTPTIEISVYGDGAGDKFHTKFTIYVNKSKNKFFLNANCAPTQLLVGDNSLPIGVGSSSVEDKAEFWVKLFILPFIFVSTLLKQYVFVKGTCKLIDDVDNYNVILPKTQFAAYSWPFKSTKARSLYMELIYQVYSTSIVRKNTAGGIDIPSVLGYKLEQDKSVINTNKHGVITSRSGFLLRFSKHDSTPLFSMGLYSKDIVNRLKREAESAARGDVGYTPDEKDRTISSLVTNSIRFDLSIHKYGYVALSRYMNSKYPEISVISEKEDIYAYTILDFLVQVMKHDPSLSEFFKYVFIYCMRMDQLFYTSKKQWDMAFDLLKKDGMGELVDKLKVRQNIHRGESLTSLIGKLFKKKNASMLKQDIFRKTTMERETDSDGHVIQKEYAGVDISFPYRVQQEARIRSRNILENPEMLDYLYENGMVNNAHNLKKVNKEAEKMRRTLYKMFVAKPLYQMPIQPKK